jgi:hypothetical protein
MFQSLWLKIRPYWLVLCRNVRQAFTFCVKCRRPGAYPCSVCACVNLCEHCQREESIKLDKKLKIGPFRENPYI